MPCRNVSESATVIWHLRIRVLLEEELDDPPHGVPDVVNKLLALATLVDLGKLQGLTPSPFNSRHEMQAK